MLSDIRLARKAGGFAFEFWCMGGDINDVDHLLQKFSTMLGNEYEFQDDARDHDLQTKYRVLNRIAQNAANVSPPNPSSENNVWKLVLPERTRLLQKWKQEIDPQTILDRTAEIHRRHQVAIFNQYEVMHDLDARCLQEQDVIGMTMTACAMNWSTLNQLAPQTVICEEAGEVMEAQSLCTLFPSVKHAIFIGDPLQLRPQVNEPVLSLETKVGASYRLDESLMERMIAPSSGIRPIDASRLDLQRRMHPEIADIMRATLYPFLQVRTLINCNKAF